MHVYKHLNINSKFTPLEGRRTIKMNGKTHCIHKDDSVWTYWARLHAHSIPDNVFICMHRQIILWQICIDSLVCVAKLNVTTETAHRLQNLPQRTTCQPAYLGFSIIRTWTLPSRYWSLPSRDEMVPFPSSDQPISTCLLLTWWDSNCSKSGRLKSNM